MVQWSSIFRFQYPRAPQTRPHQLEPPLGVIAVKGVNETDPDSEVAASRPRTWTSSGQRRGGDFGRSRFESWPGQLSFLSFGGFNLLLLAGTRILTDYHHLPKFLANGPVVLDCSSLRSILTVWIHHTMVHAFHPSVGMRTIMSL